MIKVCEECGKEFNAKQVYHNYCPKCWFSEIRPARKAISKLTEVILIILLIIAFLCAFNRGCSSM